MCSSINLQLVEGNSNDGWRVPVIRASAAGTPSTPGMPLLYWSLSNWLASQQQKLHQQEPQSFLPCTITFHTLVMLPFCILQEGGGGGFLGGWFGFHWEGISSYHDHAPTSSTWFFVHGLFLHHIPTVLTLSQCQKEGSFQKLLGLYYF